MVLAGGTTSATVVVTQTVTETAASSSEAPAQQDWGTGQQLGAGSLNPPDREVESQRQPSEDSEDHPTWLHCIECQEITLHRCEECEAAVCKSRKRGCLKRHRPKCMRMQPCVMCGKDGFPCPLCEAPFCRSHWSHDCPEEESDEDTRDREEAVARVREDLRSQRVGEQPEQEEIEEPEKAGPGSKNYVEPAPDRLVGERTGLGQVVQSTMWMSGAEPPKAGYGSEDRGARDAEIGRRRLRPWSTERLCTVL